MPNEEDKKEKRRERQNRNSLSISIAAIEITTIQNTIIKGRTTDFEEAVNLSIAEHL